MLCATSLQKKLKASPAWLITVYAAICSFAVYFCMYAFRKAFTAAAFDGESFLHVSYKIWLVAAQVIGYMLSKFYGIRFISSMHKSNRAWTIVVLIGISWLALFLFAIAPSPYNIIFLFINGLPLGMVWGLVFSYLEGRISTEVMGVVLCTSFIFSSGFVKTVGKNVLLNWHVSEYWMPFVTGALFFAPMFLFTWLLNHMPEPTTQDIQERRERPPMTKKERIQLLHNFFPGLIIIVFTYMLLTVLREFRDNFANELWTELGFGHQPSIFSRTEIPVSLVVLFFMGFLVAVKSNIKAFLINHYIIIAGYGVSLLATLLFLQHYLDAVLWMTLVGTGLYISYVPFNSLYFERMIASYGVKGNAGFVMYIADAFGYLGSVVILILKEFIGLKLSWTEFFVNIVLAITAFGIAGTLMAAIYFKRKHSSVQLPIKTAYAL